MNTIATSILIGGTCAISLAALRERECHDNRPSEGDANTVTIRYYTNYDGGDTGDDCNSCQEENFLNQNTFWSSEEKYDVCTTWPGHSGDNSITNGMCGAN